VKLHTILENWIKKYQVPGVSVAIKKDGKFLFKGGFGYRDLENEHPINENTILGTASITKMLTASAIIQLQEEGYLSVEDLVTKHIPELKEIIRYPDQMRIFHLLSHSTGLAPIKRNEKINSLEDHIHYLKEVPLYWIGTPGQYFSYSNDMFLVLGIIIERITNQDYKKYITVKFLKELRMERSTFDFEPLMNDHNVTIPYEKTNQSVKSCDWPSLGNYAVGGGLRSTAIDLTTFGEYLLENKTLLNKLATPRINQGIGHYGHGVQIHHYHNRYTLIEHSGGQPGVSSHLGIIPEENLCVAVLANISGANAADLWLQLVNDVLNLPTETKRFKLEQIQIQHDRSVYTGLYYSNEIDECIYVKNKEGSLVVQLASDELKLDVLELPNHSFICQENLTVVQFYFNNNRSYPWGVLFGSRIFLRK